MALAVIGAGMGRTGTHALKIALETVGFAPCHHMFEVRESEQQLKYWQAVARGEDVDFKEIFRGYAAQTDWPGARYWRELSIAFPNAKIILTYRAPESWYESFSKTIVSANTTGRTEDPNPHTRAMAELLTKIVFEQIFSGRLGDKSHVLKIYSDHIEEVRSTIPRERLLNFNVRDGWEPLCHFLNVPVPPIGFPRTNSQAEFLSRKKFLQDYQNRTES